MNISGTMRVSAPAKLNLSLHVRDKRADGYHELQSLIAFVEHADMLRIEPSDELSLEVVGSFAHQSGNTETNLVMRAANALREKAGQALTAKIILEKNIPVGAGLGGGSADAAAALKALRSFWGIAVSDKILHEIALSLGADVPVCLHQRAMLVSGIGEVMEPVNINLRNSTHVVLVHPGKVLNTKTVFQTLGAADYYQLDVLELMAQKGSLEGLHAARNSLQAAAIAQCADIANILIELETSIYQPDLVRMTGSGSCCFALFDNDEAAAELASTLKKTHPNWWVQHTRLIA